MRRSRERSQLLELKKKFSWVPGSLAAGTSARDGEYRAVLQGSLQGMGDALYPSAGTFSRWGVSNCQGSCVYISFEEDLCNLFAGKLQLIQ